MYQTKSIGEEIALEDQGLENLVLKRVCFLLQDRQQVGEVLQISHNFNPASYLLQAEFYHTKLPSDIFFERNLVHREHAFEPLSMVKPLGGIVISKKTGVILTNTQNHLLIRSERLADVLESISYQEQHRESFASYHAVGTSIGGLRGYDYQPPGLDTENLKFFHKGEKTESIIKESIDVVEENVDARYELWNGEKVSRNVPLGDGLEASIGRDMITLIKSSLEKEGIVLRFLQIPALKKIINIYQDQARSSLLP